MSSKLTTNVDERLRRTTKFPPEFSVKVDMNKVEKVVFKKWIAEEIAKILADDDDIVIEMIYNFIEDNRFVSCAQTN